MSFILVLLRTIDIVVVLGLWGVLLHSFYIQGVGVTRKALRSVTIVV
jgi:hypothetical protein